MAKVYIRIEEPAILTAKKIAFEDIYIPEDLFQIIKVKLDPSTGHLLITGATKGSSSVKGKVTFAKDRKSKHTSHKSLVKVFKTKAKAK